MAKANGMSWYGHVMRTVLEFEVKGKRKQRQPKKTWKTQVENESKNVGLEKEDAMKQVRWRVGIGEIAVRVGYTCPPPFMGIKPDQNWIDD